MFENPKKQRAFSALVVAAVFVLGSVLSVVWAMNADTYERNYRLAAEQRVKRYEEIPVLISGDIK